jgi:D-apionolactonase
MTPERRLALFGTDEPSAVSTELQAGLLSVALAGGTVRGLCWSGTEIIRGIAFLIRDEAWGTPPASLDPPEIEQFADRFEVRWQG